MYGIPALSYRPMATIERLRRLHLKREHECSKGTKKQQAAIGVAWCAGGTRTFSTSVGVRQAADE